MMAAEACCGGFPGNQAARGGKSSVKLKVEQVFKYVSGSGEN